MDTYDGEYEHDTHGAPDEPMPVTVRLGYAAIALAGTALVVAAVIVAGMQAGPAGVIGALFILAVSLVGLAMTAGG